MSPARVKSENELGSVTLIPVDSVVITKLSRYLAQLPSCQESSTPRLLGMVADPDHITAGKGGFQKAVSIPHGETSGTSQELWFFDFVCNRVALTDFKGKNKKGLMVHAHSKSQCRHLYSLLGFHLMLPEQLQATLAYKMM